MIDVRNAAAKRATKLLREWPLAAKIIAALALALAPLGVLAALLAFDSYREVVAARQASAAARFETWHATGLDAGQALAVALPILMWLAAVLIGWLLASSLVVRPLTRMRRGVEGYAAGDYGIRLGREDFFSREVEALAGAFDSMADRIALHEAEQQAALNEQKRLTREVHHRVKNNLQIVSSLLSIQARDANSAEVGRAYAIVQARVAALAVVHRWMYESATPSGGQDVDLRALSTDLCAGLEQGLAASEAIRVSVVCDVPRMYVGQDTALPLAFLITELVSLAARLSAPGDLAAAIATSIDDDCGRLTIAAPCLIGVDRLADSMIGPTGRIAHGMARQLRSPLTHDPVSGSYAIRFPVTVAA